VHEPQKPDFPDACFCISTSEHFSSLWKVIKKYLKPDLLTLSGIQCREVHSHEFPAGRKTFDLTPKAQTTRHRILGILDGPDYQIVFSDTPGILKPHYKMHEAMMKAVESALEDADVLILHD
jgi:hypothetical protein